MRQSFNMKTLALLGGTKAELTEVCWRRSCSEQWMTASSVWRVESLDSGDVYQRALRERGSETAALRATAADRGADEADAHHRAGRLPGEALGGERKEPARGRRD